VPWFRVLHGVLYAEHGHQHHDINRVPLILDPGDPGNPHQLMQSPAASLERARRAGRSRTSQVRAAWRAARTVEAREADAALETYRRRVDAYCRSEGLPPGVGIGADRLSEFSRWRAGLRMVSRAVRPTTPDHYLLVAAEALDKLLRPVGLGQPMYAFGHTHTARLASLASGAVYANPGSWSPLARADTRGHTYLLVASPSVGLPIVDLQYWR
jgi:hypothetical protein